MQSMNFFFSGLRLSRFFTPEVKNKKVDIDGGEKGAQIGIAAKKNCNTKIPYILMTGFKEAIYYTFFNFQNTGIVLIVFFYLRKNLGAPNLVYPELVWQCRKQPVSVTGNCVKLWF